MDQTSENFCSRMGGALCGCCGGFVLFIGSFFLLSWNEFRYVYQEVSISAVSLADKAPCSGPDEDFDDELVYVSCPVTAQPVLSDSSPKLIQQTLVEPFQGTALNWDVQIYQWVEIKHSHTTKDKVGGGETTIHKYTYERQWVSDVPEDRFFCRDVYYTTVSCPYGRAPRNHGSLPYNIRSGGVHAHALSVRIGAEESTDSSYGLSKSLIEQIYSTARIELSNEDGGYDSYPNYEGDLTKHNSYANGHVISTYPPGSSPSIGDVRVSITGIAAEGSLSLAAKQVFAPDGGMTFKPFPVKGGYPMNALKEGDLSRSEFEAELHADNEDTAIALRFGGFLLMWLGLVLITRPITLMPDLIPCVGPCLEDVAGCMLGCVDCVIALGLSLITIAVSWLSARPMLAFGLIGTGGLLFLGGSYWAYSTKGNKVKAREFEGHYIAIVDDKLQQTPFCKEIVAQP